MRDLYYPHVGMLTSCAATKTPWASGWTAGSAGWATGVGGACLEYEEDTLVTRGDADPRRDGPAPVAQDAVHVRRDVYLKRVEVHNLAPGAPGSAAVFPATTCASTRPTSATRPCMTPASTASSTTSGTSAFSSPAWSPTRPWTGRASSSTPTGTKRFAGAEGTWRDAEDGHLEGNPIAQGSVDSVISFRLLLPGGGQAIHHWIAVGRSFAEVRRLHGEVRRAGAARPLRRNPGLLARLGQQTGTGLGRLAS